MSETWSIFRTTLGKGLPITELIAKVNSYGQALDSLSPNIASDKFAWRWSDCGRNVMNAQEGIIYTIVEGEKEGIPEGKFSNMSPPNPVEKVKNKLKSSHFLDLPSSSMEEGHTTR